MYGTQEFSEDVTANFGDDVPFVIDDTALLHCQMGFLACAVKEKSPRSKDIVY